MQCSFRWLELCEVIWENRFYRLLMFLLSDLKRCERADLENECLIHLCKSGLIVELSAGHYQNTLVFIKFPMQKHLPWFPTPECVIVNVVWQHGGRKSLWEVSDGVTATQHGCVCDCWVHPWGEEYEVLGCGGGGRG